MALLQTQPRRAPRWISLGDGTTILFAIGMVRAGPRGLLEAVVRDRSMGFFVARADAQAAVESHARTLGLCD